MSQMAHTLPKDNDTDSDSTGSDSSTDAEQPSNNPYTELVFKPVMRIAMEIRKSNPMLGFNESVKLAWRTPEAHLLKQAYVTNKEKLG